MGTNPFPSNMCINSSTLFIPFSIVAAVVNAQGSLDISTVRLGGDSACNYRLVLRDSFGDAWNGGARVIWIEGVDTTEHTLLNSSFDTIPLPVIQEHPVELSYVAGEVFNSENQFELIGPYDNILYTSPFNPPTGVHYSGTVDCSLDIGVHEGSTNPSLTILPNPNCGEFRIRTSGWEDKNMVIEVFDSNGRTVHRLQLNDSGQGSTLLSLDLVGGTYMVRTSAHGNIGWSRLVIL